MDKNEILPSVASIYKNSENTEQFRVEMKKSEGNFSLAASDIIELGKAYLERFPGCYGNEECNDVRDAYEVAKICTIEYLIADFDEKIASVLRQAFSNVDVIGSLANELKEMIGPQNFTEIHKTLSLRTDSLYAIVQTIPHSIIKERFIGAIAFASNVIYLLCIYGGIS